MKKKNSPGIALLLVLAISFSLLSGCGNSVKMSVSAAEDYVDAIKDRAPHATFSGKWEGSMVFLEVEDLDSSASLTEDQIEDRLSDQIFPALLDITLNTKTAGLATLSAPEATFNTKNQKVNITLTNYSLSGHEKSDPDTTIMEGSFAEVKDEWVFTGEVSVTTKEGIIRYELELYREGTGHEVDYVPPEPENSLIGDPTMRFHNDYWEGFFIISDGPSPSSRIDSYTEYFVTVEIGTNNGGICDVFIELEGERSFFSEVKGYPQSDYSIYIEGLFSGKYFLALLDYYDDNNIYGYGMAGDSGETEIYFDVYRGEGSYSGGVPSINYVVTDWPTYLTGVWASGEVTEIGGSDLGIGFNADGTAFLCSCTLTSTLNNGEWSIDFIADGYWAVDSEYSLTLTWTYLYPGYENANLQNLSGILYTVDNYFFRSDIFIPGEYMLFEWIGTIS